MTWKPCKHAGATEVVPEAIEGSLMLAGHALALVGVPMRRVIRLVQEQREARYKLLRGFFRGADDGSVDELQQERLTSVLLPLAAKSLGQTVGDVEWGRLGVQLVSLRRKTGQVIKLTDDVVLMEGTPCCSRASPTCWSTPSACCSRTAFDARRLRRGAQ